MVIFSDIPTVFAALRSIVSSKGGEWVWLKDSLMTMGGGGGGGGGGESEILLQGEVFTLSQQVTTQFYLVTSQPVINTNV